MIEILSEASDFERLKADWEELLRDSDSNRIFLTWEWLFTWWKHLSESRKLHIITVRSGRKLIAIAPLAVNPLRLTLSPFRSLEFLGTGSIGSDYLDFIIRRGEEHKTQRLLSDYLAAGKMMVRLAQVKKGTSFAKLFTKNLEHRGW